MAARKPKLTRFMERVNPDPSGCWLWTGYIDRNGYGEFKSKDHASNRAHRTAYEMFIGPIPEGLVIDHLCRVRCCVNPLHMDIVTSQENVRRGEGSVAMRYSATHCTHGHPYTPENTRITKENHRVCRHCDRVKRDRYLARRSGRVPLPEVPTGSVVLL